MTYKRCIFISALSLTILLMFLFAKRVVAEEIYTETDEEYMREQAAKFYVPEDTGEEYTDPETGEIAWKYLSNEKKRMENIEKENNPQQKTADADEVKLRQELQHNIRSFQAVAAVDWGISEIAIPSPDIYAIAWRKPQLAAAQAEKYEVINGGTEIKIALLVRDLQEGIVGRITIPVYNDRGEEIIPQATPIYGRYILNQQAIVWKEIELGGTAVKLENTEEMVSRGIYLSEEQEPGYRMSINISKTILIKMPDDKGAAVIE